LNLEQILDVIDGQLLSDNVDLSTEVDMACGADLMSDVLAFTHSGTLLLTGLTNPQVVRTSDMAGIKAIVFVRGKLPPPETLKLAESMGIPLLGSRYTMYETCGLLYSQGQRSCGLFTLARSESDDWRGKGPQNLST